MKDYSKDFGDDRSIAVNISSKSESETENKKYFCSYCNTRLIPLTQDYMKGGYVCTKCTIEYWPAQQPVKKASKFDLPGPPTDSHGNVIGNEEIPIIAIDRQAEPSPTSYKSP
jgi:hypothetical protein